MPIYEYQCPDCGHRFEKLQKMSEGPVRVCPACGQEEVRKLVSQSAFILKGSGWYKDHYGLKKDSSAGGESKSGESASSPSASTSAASTSAASAPAAKAPAASAPAAGGTGA